MKLKFLSIITLFLLVFTSCDDNIIFEYEGDCTDKYYLQFVYDMNLKWADAFPSEVHSVNVYAFNEDGVFVKEFTAKDPAVGVPGYKMFLDLPAGKYKFVGWCGLDNDVKDESFSVPVMTPGKSTYNDLTCSLNTKTDENGNLYSNDRIYFMYHGMIDVELPDVRDGLEYVYTMPLTKDTNHIRVMVQQQSNDILAEDLIIKIASDNSVMNYNNSLLGNKVVTYYPWYMETEVLGYGSNEGTDETKADEPKEYRGVVADLSTCRLMASMTNNFDLRISKADTGKDLIFNVPFIKYALMAKPYYETAYGHVMDNQEFLDRQDEYVVSFFLDENMKWLYTEIQILDWRLVIHNYEVGS